MLVLAGCGKKEAAPAGGAPGAGAAMPPPEVGVVTVQTGDVGLVTELPGRVEASRVAQVRARAAGILLKRVFREGSDVKEGQLLYQIDPAPYNAQFQSSQATLARAEANLSQASATVERYRPLVEVNAISRQDFVNAQAAQKQAQADVAAARAGVQTAKINLDYTRVTAPISGRIGRTLVTEGALVGQGEATQLAVIQQIDPVYVNFTQSATEVMKLRDALQTGRLKRATGVEAASVQVVLEDGSTMARTGRLLFSDITVDATTGQITLRAEVPNPGGALLPGLYVRVRLEQAQATNAFLLPQQAVTRSAEGDTVTLVGADGKLAKRKVTLGDSKEANWVVLDGLKAGEQVMVDGFQKLQMMPPGAPVKPVPWKAPAPRQDAAAAASATSAPAAPPASGTAPSAATTPAATTSGTAGGGAGSAAGAGGSGGRP
ncbi:efflux RND transporter periplasmic adaptor subunit [uncultured Xylophilus sp.]|uniref:efflux RND transporter periplasmic adaptor subunit n=1 Tax=uncultured Xylophilus sp. TaxID=296832 RepID=UPI0025E32E8E|nr:efflux RND transporter periplasmic adaptor subunit [uncultured Xylophilus sp.]